MLISKMASMTAKAEKLEVPLENLNLEYISNCSNVEELEKIITVLRAEEEGLYAYLVKLAEERLSTFCPNNLLLRMKKGVLYPPQLEPGALNSLLGEIEGWQEQMNLREENVAMSSKKEQDHTSSERKKDAAHQIFNTEDKQVLQIECGGTTKSERLDVDGEKMMNQFLVQNMGRKPIRNTRIDHLASEEKKVLSLREKVKGNECFKAGEYQEAIRYYSNSIAISPSLECYNNRAIAHLKAGSFLHCISDCGKVLNIDPNNVKALLRCGCAHSKLDNREMALDAFRRILVLEPENSIASKEIEKLELKLLVPEVKAEVNGKARKKPLIEEI